MMSNWQREQDRELWRASQISNIYGQKAGQSYLEWSQAVPGILILLLVCAVFPAILLIPLGLLLLWVGVSVYRYLRGARQEQVQHQTQQASVERHQAAIDRLVHDLQVALKSGNDAAVGEVCKILAREDAFGAAIPLLRIALNDIDPCQRLCAVRGLRWGTRFIDMRQDGNSYKVITENMPSRLLSGLLCNVQESTQLRVAAAIALGNGGYIEAWYPALLDGVTDITSDVRAACCHSLGHISSLLRGDPKNRSIWMNDIDEQTRLKGFVVAMSALDDKHPRVKQEAVQALGEFRDPRALRPIQKLAADQTQSESVRRVAQEAVDAIKRSPEI